MQWLLYITVNYDHLESLLAHQTALVNNESKSIIPAIIMQMHKCRLKEHVDGRRI